MNASQVIGAANRGDFPCRLTVDFVGDRPAHQRCDHVELDLSSPETSHVIRYGQCTDLWLGGVMKLRSYRDGLLMTESEFDEWKEGCRIAYREKREDFEHTR